MVNPIKTAGWLSLIALSEEKQLQHYLCGVVWLRSHLRDYLPYFSLFSIIHWLLFYVLLGTSRCGSVHPPQPNLPMCAYNVIFGAN